MYAKANDRPMQIMMCTELRMWSLNRRGSRGGGAEGRAHTLFSQNDDNSRALHSQIGRTLKKDVGACHDAENTPFFQYFSVFDTLFTLRTL